MKTYIRNFLVTVFVSIQLVVGFVPLEASQYNEDVKSGKHFTIKKINPASPFEKEVTLELDHEISYAALIGWFKRDKPRTIPKLDVDWDISYTKRSQIVLKGDFREGQRYSLIFKPGFEIDGKRYRATKSSFVIEPLSTIGFFNQNNVIERNSKQLLHLNLKNIDRFTVHSTKIPPIYLPFALDQSIEWKETLKALDSYQADIDLKNLPSEFRELWGQLEKDKQIFNFQKSFKTKPFSIPLTFRRESNDGSIQLIKVKSESPELEAESSYRLVRITDIGITYKHSSKNLLIWLTSLQKGTPQANHKVYALDDRSQIFFLGSTNSDGVIVIKPGTYKTMVLKKNGGYRFNESRLELGWIKGLVALSNDDATFMEISKGDEFYPDGIDRSKIKEAPGENLKANVFTERGIYKPGDTVHFKGTLRQYSDGSIAPYRHETPVRIDNPKGETVLQSTYIPNEFGTLSGDLELAMHFPLGTYTIFMGSEDAYVTTRTFELQEFRAPKHKTHITFDTETRRDRGFANIDQETKYLKIKIAGQYYVGGPLKNAQVRWKIFHGKTNFKVSGYDDFRFENREAEEELIESSETILDKNGNAEFSFPIGSMVASGKRSLVVVASVIDFDGRVATSKNVYQGKPDYLVGMSKHAQTVKADMDLPIRFVVVKNEGAQRQVGMVRVNILRKGWNYIRKRNERGETYWNYQKLWKKVLSVEHEINNSDKPFVFTNSYSGDYLITTSFSSQGKDFTSASILTVENGYSSYGRSNKENPYERMFLISDKTTYVPGATAGIKFLPVQKSPAYLVTIEREGVLDYSLLQTEDDKPSLEVPLSNDHTPNIHVSILGALPRRDFPYYPSSIDEGAPNFQYGSIKLQVLKESDNLKIVVNNGVDSISQKPSSTGTLQVSVKDKSGIGKSVELAIGIIDEKVLALTRYKTPDLSSLSRVDIPLGVGTADLRSWLSKQTPLKMIWNKPLTGGGGLEKSPASNTIIRSDFNPVAYFNPSVVTDSNGNVTIKYELPDSITSYRVYIVACDKGNGFGNTEIPLIASKDFYIEPGLPRFFSKGDRFEFLVKAINKTEVSASLEFISDSTDNLSISQQGAEYYLGAMDSIQVRVKGEALSTGVASVELSGTLQDKTDAVSELETVGNIDVLLKETAANAILSIDQALLEVGQERSKLGAFQNRLQFAVNNMTNMSANTASARSVIADADYAQESSSLAKNQILQQAGTAMLAQANAQAQSVLSLLK